jgi:hypothetical protein
MNPTMPVTLFVAVTILNAAILADEPRRGDPLPRAAEVISVQSPESTWRDLALQPASTRVVVVTTADEYAHGEVRRLSDAELTLLDAGHERTIAKTDVCRVGREAKPSHHKTNVIAGLAATGAGLGLVVTYRAGSDTAVWHVPVYGAAVGALVGMAIAASHPDRPAARIGAILFESGRCP